MNNIATLKPIIHHAIFQTIWRRFGIAIAATTFLLLFASKDVYMGYFLQSFDPFLLAFLCFVIASAFYHAFYFARHKNGYFQKVRANFSNVFWLNITTTVSWLGGFYALRFIEASIVGSLNFSMSPLIVAAMAFFLKPRRTVYALEIVAGLGVLSAMIFLIWTSLHGLSSVGHIPHAHAVAGLSSALAAGIAIAGNTVFSKRLSDAGLSADFVLASRFHLLILSAIFFWMMEGMPLGEINFFTALSVLGIAFLGVLIPLYILQKVIECLEPITVSFIIIIRPVGAYLLQYFDPRLSLSGYSLAGVAAVVFFLALGVLARKGRKNGA